MKDFKRIISLYVAIAIVLVVSVIPVHAEALPGYTPPSTVEIGDVVGFGDVINHLLDLGRDDVSFWGNQLVSLFQDDYCSLAENHRHSFVAEHTQVGSNTGMYYVCEYCRKTAGEVYEEAYDTYVDNLPVNGIDSAGGFVWYPTCKDIDFTGRYNYFWILRYDNSYRINFSSLPYEGSSNNIITAYLSDNGDGIGVDAYPYSGESWIWNQRQDFPYCSADLKIPVSGSYQRVESIATDQSYRDDSNVLHEYQGYYSAGSASHYSAGELVTSGQNFSFSALGDTDYQPKWIAFHGKFYFPVFSVTPDASALVGHDYSADTRPASYVGQYQVTGQDGTLFVDNTSIISEDDNSIYNPVTNTTTTYDGWTYDYSSRTYTFDNSEGDTTTVTYGDENITIKEGDTVYNINYYITNNGASGDDSGDSSGSGSGSGGSDDSGSDSGEDLISSGDTETGLDAIRDKLLALWSSLRESFGQLPQFLQEAAPMIPEDIINLLEWCILVGILVGVWRLFRR